MMRILESQFVSNFADSLILIIKPFFCFLYHKKLNGFLSRFPGFFLYQITEIVRGKMQSVCGILHGWQTDSLRLVRLKVITEQVFKTHQNIFIYVFTRDKLTVIETGTIIQQEFYIS